MMHIVLLLFSSVPSFCLYVLLKMFSILAVAYLIFYVQVSGLGTDASWWWSWLGHSPGGGGRWSLVVYSAEPVTRVKVKFSISVSVRVRC